MTYLSKGTTLAKDDTSGYIVTRDIEIGDPLTPSQFEAYGGISPPHGGDLMEDWLINALRKLGKRTGNG